MKKILNPGTIIDGAAMAKGLLQRLKNLISSRNVSIPAPKLAIILAGNNHASQAYVKRKIKAAHYIGIQHEIIRFGEGQQSRLTSSIETLNKDSSFQGFIVQLPLPSGYNTQAILDKIDKNKDIDCLHRRSLELFEKYGQDAPIIPCTSQAIMHICDEYGIYLKGKKAMVVGKSLLVGQPAAIMLRKRGAEVKVFDRSSKDCLHEQATKSDIIVSATGHPRLIRRAHPKSIIFDVGFNREPGSSIIIGDVDIKQIKEFMLYTPVPGGIGPLTVAMLMNNVVRCWKKQYNLL